MNPDLSNPLTAADWRWILTGVEEPTRFTGIIIQREGAHYWIVESSNGADEHFDHRPTDADVQAFRDDVSTF